MVLEVTRRGLTTAADESLASTLGWISHPAATDVLMAILARDPENHAVAEACLFSLCNHFFNYGEKVIGAIASKPESPNYHRQAAIECLGNCYTENTLPVLLRLLNTEQDPGLRLPLLKAIAKQDPLSAIHGIQAELGLGKPEPSRTELLKLTTKLLEEAKDSYPLVRTASSLIQWILSETDWGGEPGFAKAALRVVYVEESRWLDHAIGVLESDDWGLVAKAAIGLGTFRSPRPTSPKPPSDSGEVDHDGPD